MRRSKFKNVALDGVILIFENCEFGVIPIESIEKIEFDYKNDTFSYTRINKDHLYSKITLKSLDIYGEYLHKLNPMFSEKMINKDKTLFERIMDGQDIVALELAYKNGDTSPEFFVPWDDKDEYTNYYQKSVYDKANDLLHIEIKGDKNE